MITLHDMKVSGNCYKVRLLLALLKIPFRSIAIEPSAGQSQTPEFLALNPKASVPFVAFEDGRTLSESNAILLHFAEGTPYLPQASFERAKVYEWLFYEQYYHEPQIAVRIALSTIHSRRDQATPERMAALLEGGNKALGVMEGALTEAPFVVGEYLSIADIALYAYTHKAERGGYDLTRFPALVRWLERVRSVPGFVDMDWLPAAGVNKPG